MTDTAPETARLAAYLDTWESTDYTREMTDLAGTFDNTSALTVGDVRALLAATITSTQSAPAGGVA